MRRNRRHLRVGHRVKALGGMVAALSILGAGCRDDGNDLLYGDSTADSDVDGGDGPDSSLPADDASASAESAEAPAASTTRPAAAADEPATASSSGADEPDSASSTVTEPSTSTTRPPAGDSPSSTEAPPSTDAAPPETEPPPETSTTTTVAPVDAGTLAFCEAIVTAELTFTRGPDIDFATATPEEITAAVDAEEATLEPLLAAAAASAPAVVAADVETVVGFVRSSLTSGEDLASNVDYRAADERVDLFVAASCGYATVAVSAIDHAFVNLPASLPAGRTTFAFTNDGAELHEMVVFRINDGVTETVEQLLALPDDEPFSKVRFMGTTWGAQGETDTETFELTSGRYVALCFVPVGTTDPTVVDDSDEPPGPPHFAVGMVAEFAVT